MYAGRAFERFTMKSVITVCCFFLFFAALALGQAQYKVLYSFGSNPNDGNLPNGGLAFDKSGNLYGTTLLGGSGSVCQCGTVFALSPSQTGSWVETVIYNFCSQPSCLDGAEPAAGLLLDASGNLYGTTTVGGTSQSGTVFELSPPAVPGNAWTETILWNFGNGPDDGTLPYSQLIWDGLGNLFGTTSGAGVSAGGTAFELTPNQDGSWSETILHTFCTNGAPDCPGGSDPMAGVAFDKSGNLYGTTYAGGFDNKWGVLYKLSPGDGAWTEKTLYKFSGASGGQPMSAVTFDNAGDAYVTAYDGSANSQAGCGGVFKFVPDQGGGGKKFSYLFLPADTGCDPAAGVLLDKQTDTAYGTTRLGGSLSGGNIYKVSGKRGVDLYDFCSEDGCKDGLYPAGSLTMHKGKLYSTTSQGGDFNHGVVFEIGP